MVNDSKLRVPLAYMFSWDKTNWNRKKFNTLWKKMGEPVSASKLKNQEDSFYLYIHPQELHFPRNYASSIFKNQQN